MRYLLPVSLLLLMVTVDLRAVVRLGRKALIMMLARSAGIIIGGPVALALLGRFLPPDTWMGLAALSGSWIGGAPNMVAIKESVGTPDSLMGPIILGLGFGAAAVCIWVGDKLPLLGDPTIISHTTWTVVLVTSLGLALSFTPVRRLEQVELSCARGCCLWSPAQWAFFRKGSPISIFPY